MSDRGPNHGPSASERVYRALLVAYPKEFRRAYGPQMAQAFGDLHREERERGGAGGLVRLWLRTLPDLASTAILERWKTVGVFSWAWQVGTIFFRMAGKVVRDPGAFYKGMDREEDLGRPVSFAVACMCVSTVLGAVASYAMLRYEDRSLLGALGAQEDIVDKMGIAMLAGLFCVLSAVITLYLFSAVAHLLVVLSARSNNGFEATLRVSAYASATTLLIWVPFVGWLASLYGFYVLFVGLRTVHGSREVPIMTQRNEHRG